MDNVVKSALRAGAQSKANERKNNRSIKSKGWSRPRPHGVYGIIMFGILFIICMFWLYILRFLAWPLNIAFPSLPPRPLTSMIWRIAVYILNIIFIFLIIAATILYFVWRVLRMIPLIGWIFDYIPPFKELRETGVFGLIEGILGIIGSGFSQQSFRNFKNHVGGFFKGSQNYARRAVGGDGSPPFSEGDYATNPNPGASSYDTRPASSSTTDGLRSKFTEAELKEIDDQYLKCVMENTDPVLTDDGPMQRIQKNIQNSNTKTLCKASMFQTYLTLMSYKGRDAFV